MAFMPSKQIPLMIPFGGKSLSEDQVNKKVVPVRRFSSRPSVTAGCSAHPIPLFFYHAQNIGDKLPNTFSCPANLWSFEQSTDDRHTSPARHWTRSYLMKDSRSWSHLSPIYASLELFKNTCSRLGVIFIHILSACDGFFLNWNKNFSYILSSVFIVEQPKKEEIKI